MPAGDLDVVVTAVEWGHGKRRNVLSAYTFFVRHSEQDPTLLNVGKAYSGLTDAEIAELTERFRVHTLQDHGHWRTGEPSVMLEVAFAVHPSPRHRSGYALHVRGIVRRRSDKHPDEIDTLDSAAGLRVIASLFIRSRMLCESSRDPILL